MKSISVSRVDFKNTVQSKYYIDKTKLISEMIDSNDEGFLFCRPRRFGKTLNMCMLYYFFSNQEDSKKLFQGLDVSKDDIAMSHGVGNGYEKRVLDFLRLFLFPVVKDNNKVKLIAFIGILRITKESLFSGMNNLRVSDTLSQKYSSYFGLTENEVKQLLEDFNQSDRYEEMKMWYNGYKFGETIIYNPWSTLISVDEKMCLPYWKNTPSEEMIENSFLHADEQSKLDIISLYENGKLQRKINMQMTLDKHFSNDIISFLVASGYLNAIKKIDHKTYELEIVNNEIREIYEDLITKYVKDSAGINEVFVKSLVYGFKDNNLKLLNIELKEIAKNTHYYLKSYEASYQQCYL